MVDRFTLMEDGFTSMEKNFPSKEAKFSSMEKYFSSMEEVITSKETAYVEMVERKISGAAPKEKPPISYLPLIRNQRLIFGELCCF